jgi:hypothetical protein
MGVARQDGAMTNEPLDQALAKMMEAHDELARSIPPGPCTSPPRVTRMELACVVCFKNKNSGGGVAAAETIYQGNALCGEHLVTVCAHQGYRDDDVLRILRPAQRRDVGLDAPERHGWAQPPDSAI